MGAIRCWKCGEPNSEFNKSCSSCGSELQLASQRHGSGTAKDDQDPDNMPSLIGQRLAHYKIIEAIGRGGFGEVFRARDRRLRRNVALKILPQQLARDPERFQRFRQEAEVLASLNHPNIVTIFSVEETEDLHFLTMELVEGKPLVEKIPKTGFALEPFFDIAVPLAEALVAAHAKRVIHRDLKPANIMVTDQGQVKVLDFGLAKFRLGETAPVTSQLPTEGLTGEGRVLGTMPYMSPEQLQGKVVDARSDIFSLGVVLFEMTTGRRPFQGETSADLVSAILKDAPPQITELNDELPQQLGRIV